METEVPRQSEVARKHLQGVYAQMDRIFKQPDRDQFAIFTQKIEDMHCDFEVHEITQWAIIKVGEH